MDGRDMMTQPEGSEESASRMMEEPAAPAPSAEGYKTESVTFRRSENDGLVAEVYRRRERRDKDDFDTTESKTYTFQTPQEAASFLATELSAGKSTSATSGLASVPSPR